MSELEVAIKNLIEAITEWKGSDVRYGESLKMETVTAIMQIIRKERIKAQEEGASFASDQAFSGLSKYYREENKKKILLKLKQSLEGEQ